MENQNNGSVTSDVIKSRMIEVSIIEFIEYSKFTANDGVSVFYKTTKDGEFLSESLSCDKEKALAFFNNVVDNNGYEVVEKVLYSKTIKHTTDNN